MANKIELVHNREPEDYVPRTSRYSESQVIYYTINDLTYLTFSTYKREERANSPRDKFSTMPTGMEYRPDLVSQEAYGTPDFWWKILEANKIKDVFEFKAGKTIRIPDAIF